MNENQTPTKRKYKANRKKVSLDDLAYNSYSRMWSKTFGKGTARLSKPDFLKDAARRGVDVKNKDALLRAARQRVATAAHQMTTEQAMKLKEQLLKLKPKALKVLGMDLKDLKSMTIQAYKFLPSTDKGMSMLSKMYEVLKIAKKMKSRAARAWISAEIYGS